MKELPCCVRTSLLSWKSILAVLFESKRLGQQLWYKLIYLLEFLISVHCIPTLKQTMRVVELINELPSEVLETYFFSDVFEYLYTQVMVNGKISNKNVKSWTESNAG